MIEEAKQIVDWEELENAFVLEEIFEDGVPGDANEEGYRGRRRAYLRDLLRGTGEEVKEQAVEM